MQARENEFVIEKSIPGEVPERRTYRSAEAALLDESLCRAIEAAESLGSKFIAQTLVDELAKHYSEQQE